MRNGITEFQPDRLSEARDARGLTQVALSELINRTSSAVSRWEGGEQTPELDAVEALSRALNLPNSFFLREQPAHGDAPLFFRSMAATTQTMRRRTCARLRWAQDISLSLQNWLDLPPVNVPQIEANDFHDISDSDIEKMALLCREQWGLGLGPISDVLLVLENAGLCVIKEEVGSATMDGLSNWSELDGRPYILIAKDKDVCVRSRLDAAHELGHLVLHRKLKQNTLKDKSAFKEIERQAFYFAGAFLMPAESFGAEIWSPSLSSFQVLKSRWKTSIGAMIKRASALGIITDEYERRLWKYYSARSWRTSEPLDDILEPENPRLMARSIRLLVEGNVRSREDLLEEFRLPAADIEVLCSLPRGYMSPTQSEVIHLPQLKIKSEDRTTDNKSEAVVVPFNSALGMKKPQK